MSVLIKGMQMPKNCAECPFLFDRDACYAMNKPDSMFLPLVCNGSTDEYPLGEFPYWEKRVDWCPLSDAGEEFMKHYRQGREDEKAEANGTLMQAFNPD